MNRKYELDIFILFYSMPLRNKHKISFISAVNIFEDSSALTSGDSSVPCVSRYASIHTKKLGDIHGESGLLIEVHCVGGEKLAGACAEGCRRMSQAHPSVTGGRQAGDISPGRECVV